VVIGFLFEISFSTAHTVLFYLEKMN